MYKDQIVNVPDNSIVVRNGKLYHYYNMSKAGNFMTDRGAFTNPSVVVIVLENADEVIDFTEQQEKVVAVPQPGPQVITIFVVKFKSNKVVMRQMICSDDWVADCYAMDQKYGVWFTTYPEAKALLK